MDRRRLLTLVVATALASLGGSLASAGTVNINPSKDNTLYEYDPDIGDLSNALGMHFFAGKTAMNVLRRGALAFDIAGNIPPGSTITAVSLSANVSRTPTNTAYAMELHALLADWGKERPSRLAQKAREHQLRLMMQHGDTVFSIQFFGARKAEIFLRQ